MWLDHELRPALGIDVFDYPFPRERGHLLITSDQADVLLVNMEADQAEIEQALTSFIGRKVTLERALMGTQLAYGELYRRFKQDVKLPADYVRDVYSSRFMQHFYTAEEIAQFMQRWTGSLASTEA